MAIFSMFRVKKFNVGVLKYEVVKKGQNCVYVVIE